MGLSPGGIGLLLMPVSDAAKQHHLTMTKATGAFARLPRLVRPHIGQAIYLTEVVKGLNFQRRFNSKALEPMSDRRGRKEGRSRRLHR